jgi:hypothetical protein
MVWAASATRSLASFAGEHLPYFSHHIEVAETLPKPIQKEYERVTRTRITGRETSGFFLLEQNQTVKHRPALIIVALIVLCATALDGTRPRKSTGKQLSCPSYESNEPAPKRGLVCGRIDSLDNKLRQPKPAKRLRTARPNNFRDDTDRLVAGAKAPQRLIDYADENQHGSDFEGAADDSEDATEQIEDATNDSQDEAGEPEDTADEPEDTSDDSEDDDDDCVE